MEMNTCVMFGLSDAPDSIYEKFLQTAEKYYLEYGVRFFVFGCYGNFDEMAWGVFSALGKKYPDIMASVLMNYDPPVEKYPREFAMLEGPQKIIQEAKTFICYVKRPYNTKRILKYMQHIFDYEQRIITNLGRR